MSTRARAMIVTAATAAVLGGLYVAASRPQGEAGPPPHTDHSPKHGGAFFMTANGSYHVEGTLTGREFRLYLYDSFTRPLDVRPFRARVGNRWLIPEPEGRYLVLPVDERSRESRMTAFVRFREDRPEDRFDFVFPQFQ